MPNPVLLASESLARAALTDIATPESIGDLVGTVDEAQDVLSFLFACTLPGYPGWNWTVTLAVVEGDEPTVLEAELMPGDRALLAPAWVPWAERLAEYRTTQASLAADAADSAQGADVDEQADDDLDDDDLDDDLDEDDDDDEGDEFVSSGVDHQLEEIVDTFDDDDDRNEDDGLDAEFGDESDSDADVDAITDIDEELER